MSYIYQVSNLALAQGITLDPLLLRKYPLGTPFWWIHHSVISEKLTQPLVARLYYILTEKPERERAVRLAALRPVINTGQLAFARAKWNAAYARRQRAYAKYQKTCAKSCFSRTGWITDNPEWAAARRAWDRADANLHRDFAAQYEQEYPNHPATTEDGLVFPRT